MLDALEGRGDAARLAAIRAEIEALARKFPIPESFA
jgi:hypothetical protein